MRGPEIKRFTIAQVQPERAFEAWTEPDHLARWFCDKVTGWPGAGSKLNMTWDRFGFSIEYSIPVIQPPRKVIYKAQVPGMGVQTLDISIRAYGTGSRIEIVETGPGAEGQEGAGDAKGGWEMSLAILKLYLENFYGKPRGVFFALKAAPYDNEQLMEMYTDGNKLSKWLTQNGSIGEVGEPVHLTMWDGDELTGTVIAKTSHELIVSWNEITGYLELKSFEINSDRKALCIRGSSYAGLPNEELLAYEHKMEASINRLAELLNEAKKG